jgi:hypothetical protein
MFKFRFNKPDKVEDVLDITVEIVVEEASPPKSLFDEAVQEAHDKLLEEAVCRQLTEMCYTKEQIRQTELARVAAQVEGNEICDLHEEFPDAILQHTHWGSQFGLNLTVDALVEKVVSMVKGEGDE